MATARSLLEPYLTVANEHLIRTFHPALAGESEVFALTEKQTGHQAWVISGEHASSMEQTHAAGRPIYIHPFFESPVGQGRKFSMTIPDPIPHVNASASMTPGEEELISRALPESVGVIVYKCECVVVLFPSREAMFRTWVAGTPYTLGGLAVGYKVLNDITNVGLYPCA